MQKYSSSPTSLSSPPSALSEPVSPTRILNAGRANIEMDEIIVDSSSVARFGVMQQAQQLNPPPPDVPLTAAGLPRKKPGRKPGSTVKPKVAPDGTEPPKQKRTRKPRDPNAPPIQRKRKTAPTSTGDGPAQEDVQSRSFSATREPAVTELTSMRMELEPRATPTQPPAATAAAEPQPATYAQKITKRDTVVSMQNLLNDDPPSKPQPAAPARQMFDPIRGNYDPVRETMVSRDPYGTASSTGPLGSPRAPTQIVNRASASPSIASLVDPPVNSNIRSPPPAYTTTSQSRFQESNSMPPSPSHPTRPAPQHLTKPAIVEVKRPAPPQPPAPATINRSEPKTNSFTSMTSIPVPAVPATAKPAPSAPVQSKKLAAVAQQDRDTNKKASSNSSSPRISSLKEALPSLPGGSERSILDFGKASPGEEMNAPSIVLDIPLVSGETNKYVNFMRMAEERYGWDALHPRLAANRERKARIAAASAALEKSGSGQSADEMDEELQSDENNSNVEMGGMTNGVGGAGTSGPEGAPAKPARKKRTFKEDEYDKDDGFVDDSELLWEERAAASKDGFFVYSGPLVQEDEKPAAPAGPAKRGRGGGRGSRGGGRGGAARGGGEGTGRGRGGGPGSRGGSVTRKPRITKLEKEQLLKEKAEREKLAQLTASAKGASTSSSASGTFATGGALGVPGQGAGTASATGVAL
ncbi:histone promoter control protein 2 [Rhypophila decipiens]